MNKQPFGCGGFIGGIFKRTFSVKQFLFERSVYIILLSVCVAFALLGVFSLQVVAQEEVAPNGPVDVVLISDHDSRTNDDGITNRAANQIFTFTVGGFFTEGGSVDLQITDPDSSAVSGDFSKTVGSGETRSINIDVGVNTFTKEGEYVVTATQTVDGQVSTNSSAYTFTIDRTAPTVSDETLTTNNLNDNTLARELDTITLLFSVSETVPPIPDVTIAGEDAFSVTPSEADPNSYVVLLDVSSSTDEGVVTYDIGTLTDVAGNTFNPDSVTLTGAEEVVVDLTNPTITIVRTEGTGTGARTVTAFASDANGIDAFEVADGETTCTAVGAASASFEDYESSTSRPVQASTEDCFKATDEAGNVSYVGTADAIAGVGAVTYTNGDGTSAAANNLLKTSTFTIAGTTTASTNYRMFVREEGGDWSTTPTTSGTSSTSGTFSDSLTRSDGDYEVAFQIEAVGDFVPALTSLIAVSEFSIDTTAPTFILAHQSTTNLVQDTAYYSAAGLTAGGVTVSDVVEEHLATAVLTLARTDTTGINDITPTSTVNTATNAVSFANITSVPNGIYTATVVLTDRAGNQATKTLNLVVDTKAPTITAVTIDNPSARSSVNATIAVTHNQSFLETLTATLSGQDCTRLNPFTITGSDTSAEDIRFRGKTGTFDCTIALADYAGNASNSFTVPSFTIKRGGGGGGVSPGKYVEVPTFEEDIQPIAPSLSPVQPTQPTQPTLQPQVPAPILPTLICGAQGERVRVLQQFLNENGYLVAVQGPGSPGQETTYFGLATERALKEYQIANGLSPTSILDAQTQAYINAQVVQNSQTLQTGAQITEMKRLLAEMMQRIQELAAQRAQ